MEGEKTAGVVVVVVVVVSVVVVTSVEVEAVSVEVELLSLDVVDVESVEGGAVSVAVELLSVEVPPSSVIPRAPEASIPALSRAPSARTIPARRSVFRPFTSPAPLLPQMRRMNDPLSRYVDRDAPGGRGDQTGVPNFSLYASLNLPPSPLSPQKPQYRNQIVVLLQRRVPGHPSQWTRRKVVP